MKKQQLARVLTVFLALGFSYLPHIASAADTVFSAGGNFKLTFYNAGESLTLNEDKYTSTYTLSPWQKDAVLYGINYWEQVLGGSFTNKSALPVNVITLDGFNAFTQNYVNIDSAKGVIENAFAKGILEGYTASDNEALTAIEIGRVLYPPEEAEQVYLTPLNQLSGGKIGTLAVTMIHELGHSLGLECYLQKDSYHFWADTSGTKSLYNSHLYDWRGVQAVPGLELKTVNHTPSGNNYFDLPGREDVYYDSERKLPYFAGDQVAQVLAGAKLAVYSLGGYKLNQEPVPGIPVNSVEISAWGAYNPVTGEGELVDLCHLELRNSLMSHQFFRNYQTFMEAELAVLQDLGYKIDLRNFYGRSIYNNGLNLTNTSPYYARNTAGNAYLTGIPNQMDYGIGLHLYGDNNTVYQAADLLAGGRAGVGIRVDGQGNNVTVNSGTRVQADGLNGNGILVAFGKNHNLTLAPGSTVTAAGSGGIGAAFDFGVSPLGYGNGARASYASRNAGDFENASDIGVDGPLVDTFMINGSLSGSSAAIHMAPNAYVRNITIGDGAHVSGAITNEWLYDYPDILAYGEIAVYTGKAMPEVDTWFCRQYFGPDELTTRLSFANSSGLTYSGNITGLKNTRLSFAAGTTEYTGTAQVLSTQVAAGASLTGSGSFILETPGDPAAHTLDYQMLPPGTSHDAYRARQLQKVGLFTNAGTLAPTTGDITIKGDLVSTGTFGAVLASPTKANAVKVSGSADVTGSKLSLTGTIKPLLNKDYAYLTTTKGLTGTVTADKTQLSPYVKLTTSQDEANAYFTTRQTTRLGELPGMTPSEHSVGSALNSHLLNSLASDSASADTAALNSLLYQEDKASRRTLKQLTSEGRAQLLSTSPLTRLTSETVYSRLDAVDYSGLVGAEVRLPQLADAKQGSKAVKTGKTVGADVTTTAADKKTALQAASQIVNFESGSEVMRTTTPVSLDASNNLWFKLFKGYETYNYNDELKNHTFGGAIGYDHAINLTTRVGGLFSYGVTNYSTDNMSGDSHDWRVGAYIDHKNGNWDYQGLVSYGRNKYDLDRSIDMTGSGLGNSTLNSDYQAKVWEVEAKARYLIPSTKTKIWQLTPYGKLSYTHTNQDAYSETVNSSSIASSGSSVFAQNIDSASYNSTRGEIGLEFKRSYDKHGGWGGSVGYKRVLSGVNPELNGTFAGDTLSGNGFTIQSDNDKNFVTYSLNVHGSLGGKWTGQVELRGEASQNTHKEIISVAAKYNF